MKRNLERYEIWRDTEYLSAFSPNTGKYGPEKTLYLDNFHAVLHRMIKFKGKGNFTRYYIRSKLSNIFFENIVLNVVENSCKYSWKKGVFFYLGFLSQTFTIHRAAGEGRTYFF